MYPIIYLRFYIYHELYVLKANLQKLINWQILYCSVFSFVVSFNLNISNISIKFVGKLKVLSKCLY